MKWVLIFLLMAPTAQAASLGKVFKPFAKLSTLTVLSAEFDGATTYEAVRSGRGYEANLMMRPFSRNVSIFPVLGASAIGVNYLALRLQRQEHKKIGKALQILWIGSHVAAGVWNLRAGNAYQR